MENLPEGNTPGPNTRKMMDDFKQQGFEAIVKQLEFCNYACEAGSLTNNVAFLALKEYAPELKAEVERLKNSLKLANETVGLLELNEDNARIRATADLQALTERQAKEIELLTTENSIHRKSESELTKRLSQQLSEKTAEVGRLQKNLYSPENLIGKLSERCARLGGLLKEVLEYDDKYTVAPRPPHPYYTLKSRIKSALESKE